jgi:hypothetical protein
MNLNAPFNNHGLKDSELALLRKGIDFPCFPETLLTSAEGNFQTVADLLLTSTQDIAKRCKSPPLEIKRIVDAVLSASPWPEINRVDTLDDEDDEHFTTGDVVLDRALGGGIRTGMVWEVVGERYAQILSRFYGWMVFDICYQFCWKNPTCTPAVTIRPSPSRLGGTICMCLLSYDVLETADESFGPIVRA